MLLPLLAVAQDNKAISASFSANGTYTTHNRLQIPLEAAGMHRNVNGDDFASYAVSYSFGMWFKLTSYYSNGNTYYTADTNTVLADFGTSGHSNNNGNWTISVYKDGTLKIGGHGVGDHGLGQMSGTLASSVSLNEWHYVLLTIDNTADNAQVAVYYDGTQVLNQAATGKIYYPWADDYNIHAFGLGSNGALDEIQLWNRALTAEEAAVAQVNAQAVNGLTALYTFDEEVSTGTFANQAVGGGDYNAVYQALTGTWYSDGGLVPVSSAAATATTLVDGREIAATEASVTFMEMEGGVLSATDGTNTYATAETPYTIMTGTELTVTATPDAGYSLIGIYAVDASDNRTEIANGGKYTVVKDVTIAASFTNETYALTVNNSLNVPYTLTYGGTEVSDLTQLMGGGAEYKLTLNVPESMVLESVQLGTETLTAVDGVYTITLDADATLTINARNKAQYTVTINQPTGGTVAVAKGTTAISSGDKVLEGDVLTLSNTKDSGYTFVNYVINGSNTTAETYTVTGDVTISALFEEGVEYCYPEGNASRSDTRGITSLTVSDDQGNTATVTGAGTSATHALYTDQTSTVFVTKPGATVTIKNNGSGTWMSSYVYVDYDKNGTFDFTAANCAGAKVDGELVSHTGYSGTSSDPTVTCTGSSIDWGSSYSLTMPTFVIPEDLAPGNYRIRHKVDWNCVDPCGRLSANGFSDNFMDANGGGVIDFTIRIESEDYETARTITVASADETYGTVAITDPATSESSISTVQKGVTVKATPAANYAFMNWSDGSSEVATTATYTYTGENDVTLTANFGGKVTYTVSADGSATVAANGAGIASESVVAIGTEVTVTVNPNSGKECIVTIDGNVLTLTDNVCTFTVESNAVIDIQFVDQICHINYTISGNGSIQIWTGADDAGTPSGTQLQNGDLIPANTDLHVWFIPTNDDETLESVVVDNGGSLTTLVADLDYYNGLDADECDETAPMAKAQYYPVPSVDGDINITATFSTNTQGIEEIGIDPANGPVEYYNLQGVRVAADNLVPGFYIVRQGSKTAKVLIQK